MVSHTFGREYTYFWYRQDKYSCITFRSLFFSQTSLTAAPICKIRIKTFGNVSATVIQNRFVDFFFVSNRLNGGRCTWKLLIFKQQVAIYKEFKSLDNWSLAHGSALVSSSKHDKCFSPCFACRVNEFHGRTLFLRFNHPDAYEQKRVNARQRRTTMRVDCDARYQSPDWCITVA